jgi:hypothetical protein
MRIIIAILLSSVVAVGCGVNAEPAVESPTEVAPPTEIEVPTYAPVTKLGLIHEGSTVQVGDLPEKGLEIFPAPEKRSAVNELPEWWPKGYQASGWDNDKEGFAMILEGGRIVAALHQVEDLKYEDITRIVKEYVRSFEQYPVGTQLLYDPNVEPSIPLATCQNASVRYWIWEEKPYRCVICATTKDADRGPWRITEGVGYASVMDALRMNSKPQAKP